jgi:hypothetical protein
VLVGVVMFFILIMYLTLIAFFSLYHRPLCITVADAERNGMPTHSDFITQLRQDIHDRVKMIEYFCQSYNATHASTTADPSSAAVANFNFDPNSLKDVHRVKSCISKLLTAQAWEAFDRRQRLQVSTSGASPPSKKARSQWSSGKERTGSESSSTACRNASLEQQDLISRLVDNILATHPLLLLIKELRSHVRLMPLLQSILNYRFRPYGGDQHGRLHHQELDRVRGVFNTLGTETGRLTVTMPPLQQIPHQCVFTKTERTTLFTELMDARARGGGAYQELVQRINRSKPGAREWVRMTSLASKASSVPSESGSSDGPSSQQALAAASAGGVKLSSISNGIYSCVGGSVGNISQYSSGKLVCILDRNITQPIQCATTKNVMNLFEIWQKAGFSYTQETARQIPIVVVDIKSQQYFYPADQVVRLLAPLLPSYQEAQALQHASLSLSQAQPPAPPLKSLLSNETETGTPADPMLDLLAKQLAGQKITSEEYDGYWRRCSHLSVGQELTLPAKLEVNPRDVFCASKGYVLMTSDYCQIELRILAHFSLDENLCGAFRDPLSEDIFKCIASRWQGVPVSEITSEERNRVKELSYALLYGAGPGKVAADANCSVSQAETWINQFLSVYPGIKVFMKEVKSSCAKLGYVQTMLGRRRYLPHIRHVQRKERSRAERQAVNTVCQGSAADLIKLAMINIHHTLCQHFRGRNYHARRSVPGGGLYTVLDAVRPVLQIHDELVFEVHEKYVHEVARHIQHCMENAVELNVPLQVKINVGSSFGSLVPLELSAVPSKRADASTQGLSLPQDNENINITSSNNSNIMLENMNVRKEVMMTCAQSDTPSSYDARNRNRRESGNLQPHPLLAMSAAELLVRTSRKREREAEAGSSDTGGNRGGNYSICKEKRSGEEKQQQQQSTILPPPATDCQQQLPVARCIFSED